MDERTEQLKQVIATDRGEIAPTQPSTTARALGFVAVLAAGAAGWFIGYAVTDLQCSGDCSVQTGVGGLVGAVIAAVGVGVVVQLALRAMSEWRVQQARRPVAPPDPVPGGTPRARPRVR